MTSESINDAVVAARIVLAESGASRSRGGMTLHEHGALLKLELAIVDFLEEVGA